MSILLMRHRGDLLLVINHAELISEVCDGFLKVEFPIIMGKYPTAQIGMGSDRLQTGENTGSIVHERIPPPLIDFARPIAVPAPSSECDTVDGDLGYQMGCLGVQIAELNLSVLVHIGSYVYLDRKISTRLHRRCNLNL
jgi:hypothetical protein